MKLSFSLCLLVLGCSDTNIEKDTLSASNHLSIYYSGNIHQARSALTAIIESTLRDEDKFIEKGAYNRTLMMAYARLYQVDKHLGIDSNESWNTAIHYAKICELDVTNINEIESQLVSLVNGLNSKGKKPVWIMQNLTKPSK